MRGRRLGGFTLVEMLVMLAVLGVLTGVGTPALRSLVASVRLSTATNGFFASLLFARSEAVRRRSYVALCLSADGASCTTQGTWQQGWIVFHDANRNGARDPGEPVLEQAQALAPDLRVSGNLHVASLVSYTPLGNTRLVSGALQSGTITFCNVGRAEARELVISTDGRPRVQKKKLPSCS